MKAITFGQIVSLGHFEIRNLNIPVLAKFGLDYAVYMIISRSPLRISLMGGGSDLHDFYKKDGGHSLTFTINKYVYLAINEPFADEIRLSYSKTEIVTDVNAIQHPIFKAALRTMKIENKIEIGSFADVPSTGSGLGSSSAFTVALLSGLHAFKNETIDKSDLANLACDIEIKQCGDPIGKQDQYASAFGGFNEFYFNSDESVETKNLKLSSEVVQRLRSGFFLIYLGFGRGPNQILTDQISNLRNTTSSAFGLTAQLRDMVPSTQRALMLGDLEALGCLLDRGWKIKKQLSHRISNSKIDELYLQLLDWGGAGGKLVGAGGGGFLFMCVPPRKQDTFKRNLLKYNLKNVFDDFDYQGTQFQHV